MGSININNSNTNNNIPIINITSNNPNFANNFQVDGGIYFLREGVGNIGSVEMKSTDTNASPNIIFSTINNGNCVTIDNFGNVGVGTVNPDSNLHVFNNTNSTSLLRVLGGNNPLTEINDNVRIDENGVYSHYRRNGTSLETRFINLGQVNNTGSQYHLVNSGNPSSDTSWNGFPGVYCDVGAGEYRIHGRGSGSTCAIRSDGGFLTFTGSHDTFTPFTDEDIGKIVYSTGEYSTELKEGVIYNKISVMDSCPIVALTTKARDDRVIGVLSNITKRVISERVSRRDYDTMEDRTGFEQDEVNIYTKYTDTGEFSRGYYNALGEGAIWVTNKQGNLKNGDYIESSDIPGYGQKQLSNINYNYTVAKITCDCDFTEIYITKKRHVSINGNYQYNPDKTPVWEDVLDENGNTITFLKFKLRYFTLDGEITTKENAVYKAALVGCTYHCG